MMDFATGYTTAFMAAFGGSVQPSAPLRAPPPAPPAPPRPGPGAAAGRGARSSARKRPERLGTAGWGAEGGWKRSPRPPNRRRAPFQPQQAPPERLGPR